MRSDEQIRNPRISLQLLRSTVCVVNYGGRRRCGTLSSQPPGASPDPKIKFTCDGISVSLSPRGGRQERPWIFPGLFFFGVCFFTHLLLSLTHESGYEEQRQCEESWTRKMDREMVELEFTCGFYVNRNRNGSTKCFISNRWKGGWRNRSLLLTAFFVRSVVCICKMQKGNCKEKGKKG